MELFSVVQSKMITGQTKVDVDLVDELFADEKTNALTELKLKGRLEPVISKASTSV